MPRLTAFLLLAVLVLLAWGRPLLQKFPFVWEDRTALSTNPIVTRGEVGRAVTNGLWAPAPLNDRSGTYRPVALVSHAVVSRLTGFRPWSARLCNLLLEFLCSLLLFLLARRILGEDAPALAAAALFAVHPMAAGILGWASGRAELLAMAFGLGALLAHARARDDGGLPWPAAILALLAMLSHEAGLALLFLIPMLDHSDGAAHRPRDAREYAERYWVYVACVAIYMGLRLRVHPYQMNLQLTPVLLVALTVLRLWFYSATVSVLPFLAPLFTPVRLGGPAGTEIISHTPDLLATLGIIALLALIGLAVWLWRKNAAAGFGLSWFLVGFLPVLNPTIALHSLVDQLTFFPLAGLCLCLAALALQYVRAHADAERAVGVAVGAAVLIWLAVSGARAGLWASEVAYLDPIASHNPKDARAWDDLGVAYMQAGNVPRALQLYHRACAADSSDAAAAFNLGQAYMKSGRADSARLVLIGAVRANPHSADLHLALGSALLQTGAFGEAKMMFTDALLDDSTRVPAYMGLAQAVYAQGNAAEAAHVLLLAHDVTPSDPAIPNDLGLIYQSQGRVAAAESCFSAAIRLNPGLPQFYYNLARLRFRQGDYAGASGPVDELVRLLPGNPGPLSLRDTLAARIARQRRGR